MYSVTAYALGYTMFTGTLKFVPRIGETLSAEVGRFKVLDVTYEIAGGPRSSVPVTLTLEPL
jgi:hypothetical protein